MVPLKRPTLYKSVQFCVQLQTKSSAMKTIVALFVVATAAFAAAVPLLIPTIDDPEFISQIEEWATAEESTPVLSLRCPQEMEKRLENIPAVTSSKKALKDATFTFRHVPEMNARLKKVQEAEETKQAQLDATAFTLRDPQEIAKRTNDIPSENQPKLVPLRLRNVPEIIARFKNIPAAKSSNKDQTKAASFSLRSAEEVAARLKEQ